VSSGIVERVGWIEVGWIEGGGRLDGGLEWAIIFGERDFLGGSRLRKDYFIRHLHTLFLASIPD
jgi:hypothetical protein